MALHIVYTQNGASSTIYTLYKVPYCVCFTMDPTSPEHSLEDNQNYLLQGWTWLLTTCRSSPWLIGMETQSCG